MSRSTRSVWNFVSVAAFNAVSMLLGLLSVPILLHNLGPTRLGAARAVTDWVGHLGLLDIGVGDALAPLLARQLAKGDVAATRALLVAGFKSYLRVVALMLAAGLVLVAGVAWLVPVEPSFVLDLRYATIVALIPVALVALSPLRTLAEAGQRGYLVNVALIAQNLTFTGAAIVAALGGWGITGQSVAMVAGAVVYSSCLVIDGWMQSRTLLQRTPVEDAEARRALWQLTRPTFILRMCGRIGLMTDNVVIGLAINPAAIVPFLMTQRLAQIAQGQLLAVGNATWASLAELHAHGDHTSFVDRYVELSRLLVVFGIVTLVPIVAYNEAFVSLWLGHTHYGGLTLTILASVNAMILALASFWGWAFGATGQLAHLVTLGLSSAILNLVISVGVTSYFAARAPQWALLGPLLGTLIAYSLLNMPMLPVLLQRHFGVPVERLVGAVVKPLMLGIPYGIALWWIAHTWPPTTWLMLIEQTGAGAALLAAMSLMLLFSGQERSKWISRLRTVAVSSS